MNFFRQQPHHNKLIIALALAAWISVGYFVTLRAFRVNANTETSYFYITSISPSSTVILQGGSATLNVQVTGYSGWDQPISFSVNGTDSTFTSSFSPSTVTPTIGNPVASTTLTLATSNNTVCNKNYTVTISGVGGSGTSTINALSSDVSFYVQCPTGEPDYVLIINPQGVLADAGTEADYAVTMTSLNGYTGAVSLSPKIDGSWSPYQDEFGYSNWQNVQLDSNLLTLSTGQTTATTTLRITSIPENADNHDKLISNHSVQVSGTGAKNVIRSTLPSDAYLTVRVPPDPSSTITATAGMPQLDGDNKQKVAVTFTNSGTTDRRITIAADTPRAGLFIKADGQVGSHLIALANDASAVSNVTAEWGDTLLCGTYVLNVREIGWTNPVGTASFTIDTNCTSSNFTFNPVQPNPLVLAENQTTDNTYTVSATPAADFTGDITVTWTDPHAPNTTLSPNSLILNAANNYTGTITVIAGTGASNPGNYSIDFTAVSGLISQTVTGVALQVQPPPDFSISSVTPNPLTMDPNSAGNYTVMINRVGSFTGDVKVNWTAVPTP